MARQPRANDGAAIGRRPGSRTSFHSLPAASASREAAHREAPLLAFLDDPRTRTATIPIFLWVCAAVVAHIAGGFGSNAAAELVHERDELRAAVRAERAVLRPADTTFELMTDNAEPSPQKVEPPKEDVPGDAKGEGEPDPDTQKADKPPKPTPTPKEAPKPEPPKPEPPKEQPKPEPPKPKPPEPLKPLAPLPAAPAPQAPPPPPPPPEVDHRQAIRQRVKKDQEDNKTANRLADDANTVEKETVARARAQDVDSAKPSMGPSAGGPKDDIGNDKEQHSGSHENHKGDDKHAPGENKANANDAEHERPKPPVAPTPNPGQPPAAAQGKGGKGAAPAPAAPPPSPGGAGPASPEVTAGDKGSYTLDPANPGGDGKSRNPGRKRAPSPFESPVHVGALGLGGTGMPGGPQVNLNQAGVEAAVGAEQFQRERAADGAARRAAHRGKWEKNKFDKYRPAIENYEPSVQLDNTTSLNAARSPFATYIHTIHNRIHPIFAEEFLEFLNGLPKGHTLNQDLVTHLEIVLDKTSGKVVRRGVTKASGVTAFDIAALSAVDRAGPYGKAPDIIASPDDNVYLHWEFHRDPFDACTTRNARPYILKNAPKKATAPVGPLRRPPAGSKDERSVPSGPLRPIGEH